MSQYSQNQAQAINEIIIEQSKLLTEASEVLTTVLTNVYGFLDELSKFGKSVAIKNEQKQKDYEETLNSTGKLTGYIDQVHLEIPALVESINETDAQLKTCQKQLALMKQDLEKSNNLLAEANQKREALDKESNVQANYTAALGSIMGSMLWKTSKTEDIIETFISTGTINEFIIMSNVTINSFMDSFVDNLPHSDSYEYKFALSIIGTNINISAQRIGRDFILGEKIGLTFINNILDHLDRIKMPDGRLLKRMCLIFLYNISICKRGAVLIQTSQNGIGNILRCFGTSSSNEIQSLSLTLMISLINEISTPEFGQQVMKLISRDDLQYLMEHNDENLNQLCRKFQDKVRDLEVVEIQSDD